jgi:NAD(P)-dependent dehydrogenase (short-subunit alcohol dehydrogenase family)
MFSDLKGKVAVVTGAGKRTGIGFGVARELAACGCRLVVADLGSEGREGGVVAAGSVAEMESIAEELGAAHSVETLALSVDITRTESVARMAERIREAFGQVDVLCNNAGAVFGVPNAVHTYSEADWLRTIDVNLHGAFRVSRALLPLMLGRPGSIVNTASRAGKVPPIFNGAYAVAKAGLIMLTKVMARELAGAGIRVNAVCPGQIRTDMETWRAPLEAGFLNESLEERNRRVLSTIPLNRFGTPEEVGRVVAFLASASAAYMTGQALNITGGQLMEL